MDNFISMAKKGYAAYEESQQAQQNQGQQGQGAQQPQGQDQQQQGHQQNYQQDSQGDRPQQGHQRQDGQGSLPVNHGEAAQIANSQSGNAGNSEMFSQAMAFLSGGNHTQPVNEQHITEAHNQVYGSGDASNAPAASIGSAAALQTLKSFISSGSNQSSNSGGGDFQTKMIGMAMAEAAKTFDSSGNQGDKQEAVSGAAVTMMKLLVQSKMSGGGGGGGMASLMGGSNSGGMGSILQMASQFTK